MIEDNDCSTWASRMAKRAEGLLRFSRELWTIVVALGWLCLIVALIVVGMREVISWL